MSITILLLPPARGDSYKVLFFMADLPWHIINLTEQICFDLFIKLNIAIIFVYYCVLIELKLRLVKVFTRHKLWIQCYWENPTLIN